MLVKFTMIRPDKFADLVKFVESDDNRVKTRIVQHHSSDTESHDEVENGEVAVVEILNFKKTQDAYKVNFLDVELKMEDDIVFAVQKSKKEIVRFHVPVPLELYDRVFKLLGLDQEALGDNRPLVNKHGQQINSDDALKLWRAMQEKFGKNRQCAGKMPKRI